MPSDECEAVLWESVAPGPGLCARPSGQKTWIVHRRCAGVVIKRTLGPLDALPVEDARHAARALITDAAAGDRAALTIPTVWAFVPTFLADFAERWSPRRGSPIRSPCGGGYCPRSESGAAMRSANCCHEILRSMFDCAIA